MTSFAVMKNVLRRIVRDVRTMALIVILPLFFVLLYGNSFSGSYSDLKILVVNEDNGLASVRTAELGRITLAVHLASTFVDTLDPKTFSVTRLDDAEAALASVGDGVWAALVFPSSFSNTVVNEAVRAGGRTRVRFQGSTVTVLPSDRVDVPLTTLVIDDSNPLIAAAVLEALRSTFARVLESQQSTLTVDSLLDVRPLHEGKIQMLDFTAPGIIGFAMTLITIMLTAMAVVRERTGGTLTRILIAPASAWQVTLGYTWAFSLIAVFQAAELLIASILLFHIRFVGSPGAVVVVVLLFAVGLQGLATLISTVAKNEAQAMQFVLFLLIPSIMLSGVFWPLESMPAAMRPFSYAIPLTYANSALRKVMLTGSGLGELGFELSVLGGIALVTLVLSVLSMRRQAYTA
ncbi:MAG: ABC transporter permease [Candidatus Bipolaricaulis sp.]|nr:ABC transporter permease [Candidatus Bipolaricaulis sp.]